MVDIQKVNEYNQNILLLNDINKKHELYSKDFVDGAIQDKADIGWLISTLLHYLYCVVDLTGLTHLVDDAEKAQFEKLFKDCTLFLTSSDPINKPRATTTLTLEQLQIVDKIKNTWREFLFSTFLLQLPKSFKILNQPEVLQTLLQDPTNFTLDTAVKGDLQDKKNHFVSLYQCLEAGPMLSNALEKFQDGQDPLKEVIGLNNFQHLLKMADAIRSACQNPDAYLAQFKSLHDEFVADGTRVEIIQGRLLPTKEQLKKAFKLVLEKHFAGLPPPTSQASGAMLARLVQYVICGERLKDIPQPEHEVCFSCKETAELVQILPIRQFSTALDWYLRESDHYRKQSKKVKSQKELMHGQIHFYLEQFWKDAPRLLDTKIGRRAPVDPKTLDAFEKICSDIREDFFNFLKVPNNFQSCMTSFQAFAEMCNIPLSFDHKLLKTWCTKVLPSGSDSPQRLAALLRYDKFTGDQFRVLETLLKGQLGDGDLAENNRKLNWLLRIHLLQFMLFNQQSSLGIQACQIEAEKSPLPPGKRLKVTLGLDSLISNLHSKNYHQYRFEANCFVSHQVYYGGILQEESKKLNMPLIRDNFYFFIRWTQEFIAPLTLASKPGEPHSSLVHYKQVEVSPFCHPFLDKIIESLKS